MRPSDDLPLPLWLDGRKCRHRAGGVGLVDLLVERAGIPEDVAVELHCRDVHALARVLMRAAFLARADRALLLAECPPRLPFWRGTAGRVIAATVVIWLSLLALVFLVRLAVALLVTVAS